MPLPDASSLASQLFEVARTRANQHGLQLRPDVTGELQQLAEKGAREILNAAGKKPLEAQDAYIRGAMRVASESIATLIDEMTSARFRIDGYLESHPTSLGERTLGEALTLLCPLWPFC